MSLRHVCLRKLIVCYGHKWACSVNCEMPMSWVLMCRIPQMPFADDVRRYTFASFDNLVTKKGQVVTSHPYIPTEEQLSAMDDLVDALDLMEAGEKDEEG